MVLDPGRFDVIVASNLFGDILSDLGPATAGTIGIAPSGNINPERSFPSLFEPVHGSAPDIAGQQKADPTAAILSAGMLLDHLGYRAPASLIEHAVAEDLAARPDAPRSTAEVGDAIASSVDRLATRAQEHS